MKPTAFAGSNAIFAKDQPEYLPLSAHIDSSGIVTTCWVLGWAERFRVLMFGRLWNQQMTFNKPLQPQKPSIECPLERRG